MKNSDRESFLKTIMGFAELKGKKLSTAAFELYWGAMQDWSIEDFRAAANRLLKTCEFMPTPKDFEDLRKAGKQTPGEVFGELRGWLVYSPNGYSLAENTPPVIAAAVRAIGGANAYAMCDTDKLHFLEKRFCEHYEAIRDSHETREALPQVANDVQPDWLPLTSKHLTKK